MTPGVLAHAIALLREELLFYQREHGAFETPAFALDRVLAAARRVVRTDEELEQK